MTGPAVVPAADPAADPAAPSSLSPRTVTLLRRDVGFGGLLISDDLDSPATLRDQTVQSAAVQAIAAGVDLLLLAAGPQLQDTQAALVDAVATNQLPRQRLHEAAERVRALAAGLDTTARGDR